MTKFLDYLMSTIACVVGLLCIQLGAVYAMDADVMPAVAMTVCGLLNLELYFKSRP